MASVLIFVIPCTILARDAHTRIGSDSLFIASQNVWYLEEYDSEGRSSNGTRWVDGKITERISWFYSPLSLFPVKKIATGTDRSTEILYDAQGNEIQSTVTGATGEILSKTVSEWLSGGRIKNKTTVDSLGTLREEYDYSEDGVLTDKRVLKNGSIIQRIEYLGGEDRLETLYKNGVRVLTVMVQDGKKSEIRDE